MTPTFNQLSSDQLRQALALREQIDSLQAQFDAIFNGGGDASIPTQSPAAAKSKSQGKSKGKPTSAKAATKSAPKKGGSISPERRAKLAAAMKASWAARKQAAAENNA